MPYTSPDNPYGFNDDGSITLMGDGAHKTHKASGTDMAGIIGCSKWATRFTVACHLLGLGREDISSKPAVKRGVALEGKIIRYADETYGDRYGQFMSADQVFEKRVGDHDSWVSDFEDDIFAGHVDGIVSRDGEDYILEIKTTATPEDWENGVPEYYFWQVALYNHFITKQDVAYVVVGIANENTDRDPASWVATKDTVKLYAMPIDQEMVAKKIDEVREWCIGILESETTPAPSDAKCDVALFEHLCKIAESVDSIQAKADEYMELVAQIDEHDNEVAPLLLRKQELWDELRDWFIANEVSVMESGSGQYTCKLSVRDSSKLEETLMVADGIDPQKYKVHAQTKTFTIKPVKKSNKEE